jgi:hypothetical protein
VTRGVVLSSPVRHRWGLHLRRVVRRLVSVIIAR